MQLKILGAVLCAMKGMGEQRHLRIEGEELQRASVNLVIPFLNADRVTLKCLAVETLGRMAQAVCEPQVKILVPYHLNFKQISSLLLVTRNSASTSFERSETKSRERDSGSRLAAFIATWGKHKP